MLQYFAALFQISQHDKFGYTIVKPIVAEDRKVWKPSLKKPRSYRNPCVMKYDKVNYINYTIIICSHIIYLLLQIRQKMTSNK